MDVSRMQDPDSTWSLGRTNPSTHMTMPDSDEPIAPPTASRLFDGLPVMETVPTVMKLGAANVVEMSKEPINRDGTASIYTFVSGGNPFAGKFDVTGDKSDDLARLTAEYDFHKRASGHENIAEPYGMAVHPLNGECQPVLMMELVDGINCYELRLGMRAALKNGYISYPEFCGMEAAVKRDQLRATAHWTRRGIVHCDLKPQNVMVERTGDAKVIDYGLAQNMGVAWVGPYGYKAPEQFDDDASLNAVEKSKRPSIGAQTDPFAAGASTLAVFEGDDYGLLDAPGFFKLDGYLKDLKPRDVDENDPRYAVAGAARSLSAYLETFLATLNANLQHGRFSREEVEAQGKKFEGLCQEWLEAYTAQVLNDDERYNPSALREFANRDVFSDLVKSFKETMTTTGALSPDLLSEVRPPNTGLIVEPQISKDKSGKVIRRRGVFAAETALTRFIDLTMKKRCTAEEALASPFIKESVLDEARAKKLLQMVVEKTRDGTIFKPKGDGNASRAETIRGVATTDITTFKSDVEERPLAGHTADTRKAALEQQLSQQWSGWRVGSVRSRAAFYERLAPARAAPTMAPKEGPAKKRKLNKTPTS